MACTTGDACVVSKSMQRRVTAPNHACLAQCGGVLHGVCGAQETWSGNEMHRICRPCLATSASKEKRNTSADGKRKLAQQGLGVYSAGATKKKPSQSTARIRLTIHNKAQRLLDEVENVVPPPFSDISVPFGQLEEHAEASGNADACHLLRRAKT